MPIRIRLAVLFAVAAAITLTVGSIIYLHILSHELHNTIDSELDVRAQTIRTVLAQPKKSPTADLAGSSVFYRGDLAQVYGSDGRVLASSPTGAETLLDPAQLRLARTRTFVFDAQMRIEAGDSAAEHVRLLAAPVNIQGRVGVLAVGASLEPTDDALDKVSDAAQWGAPIGAVVAGLAAWFLAGAALRPVERMRRQAAAMSAEESEARIAVPGTRDELAALARTMNDLLSRLHDALDRERAFVADAGHELRTPLAILRAELELASRPGRSLDELQEAVSSAANEAQRLSHLANDLLVLARDGTAGLNLEREPTTVASLLQSAVDFAQPVAVVAGVAIHVDAPADLVADIDPRRVRRLVENLVDNAIRHTPSGGTVTIRASADQERLRLSVDDTGTGFPPDFLPHAFERFRRADASRTRDSGGTGLGLAIVRSIAEAHRGQAHADNLTRGGATVTVELADAVLADPLEP